MTIDSDHIDDWTGKEVARLLALVEAERRYYREILACLPIGAVTVSRDQAIMSANRRFYHLMNLGPENVRDRKLAEVFAAPQLRASVEQALRAGASQSGISVEVPGRTLRASVTPLRGWDAAGREALIAVEDVALPPHAAENRDLSRFPAMLWTLDPETLHFESVEGDEELLLGYSRQHWLSTPDFWLVRVHASDRQQVEGFCRSAIRLGGQFACEFRAVAADGKISWRRDSFRVSIDEKTRVTRISGVSVDITARRQAEQDNILANRVEALAGLSRHLSHDLNNALMIVTGYGEELIAQLPEDEARRQDVQAILSAAEMMAGVTGELQGFTRKQASAPAPMDITALVTAVAARIREKLGATLVLRQPRSRLQAVAEATQLEAALFSIARRLRDRNDPHMIIALGETRISELANLKHALKPGLYIDIAVRGPYTAELPVSSIESFLSGKDPHGSDMARTYAIIREWGGSMVVGRTDHLSEVRVLLPAVPAPETPAGERRPAEPRKEAEPEQTGLGTILVVEEEKGIRSLVRKILTREGYEVLEAATPEEALEAARQHRAPIRLLLADMKASGHGGRQLALNLSERYPQLRVLYISGYADDPDQVLEDLRAGDAFLQKPFTLAALVKKVREAIEPGRRTAGDSGTASQKN